MNTPTTARMARLWKLCQSFVSDNRVSCPESICQMHSVMENAEDLVEGICKIVGWHEYPKDEDDE